MNWNGIKKNDKIIFIELIILITGSILVFIISSIYDFLEQLFYFSTKHENWELDEIIPVALFLLIAMVVLLIRRRRELRYSENMLIKQNDALEKALSEIKQLQGILPICAECKKIRDDEGIWHQIEAYIHAHSEAEFSHGVCPDCIKKLYPDLQDE